MLAKSPFRRLRCGHPSNVRFPPTPDIRSAVANIPFAQPLAGIERGGYRLVYRDTPTGLWQARERLTGVSSFIFSLGLSVSADGEVQEVRWESPAYAAAITAGATLLGVNGMKFSSDELSRAIADAGAGRSIRLLVQAGCHQREVEIDVPEGHRYPHLEPATTGRRRLDDILSAK